MKKHQKLPLLPSSTYKKFQRPKENNCLPHCFLHLDGTNLFVEKNPSDIDWMFKDKRILCFNANYCKNCADCEKHQFRPVKIFYFTEDGTIKVIETTNSGTPLCLVQRQPIPCDSPGHSDYLTYKDLTKSVKIFDQVYNITDCDDFTRLCLSKAGIEVNQCIDTPNHHSDSGCEHSEDDTTKKSKQSEERPKEVSKHQQFLNFDKLRLKFNAYWDDRDSPFGEIHKLSVYYYLADKTIQIIEHPKNERPSVFYKRLKLPKRTEDIFLVHQKKNPSVLGITTLDKSVMDKTDHINENDDYYTDGDLKIGEILNVFGRKVMLTDCDEFTRDFYEKQYGFKNFVPIETPESDWAPVDVEKSLPPYNGWGSYEDSEGNCLSIIPKANKCHGKSMLKQNNSRLRFKAEIVPKFDDDTDREFVITNYLDDDTISVFEIGKKNFSSSGEFLKRSKFYLPHQLKFINSRPEIYTSQLLYIGAIVDFNRFIFRITDADEFTLYYMESHESKYPKANINSIMRKVKEAIEPVYQDFMSKYLGKIPKIEKSSSNTQKIQLCYKTTTVALKELLGDKVTQHEIVTFLRYFSADKQSNESSKYDRSIIQSMVQTALTNHFWDNVQELQEKIYSRGQLNYLEPNKLKSILKGCRIPIKSQVLDDMFLVLKQDENGNIDVNDLLQFIDVKKFKAPPIQPMNSYDDKDKKVFDASARPKLVDWTAWILYLGL